MSAGNTHSVAIVYNQLPSRAATRKVYYWGSFFDEGNLVKETATPTHITRANMGSVHKIESGDEYALVLTLENKGFRHSKVFSFGAKNGGRLGRTI